MNAETERLAMRPDVRAAIRELVEDRATSVTCDDVLTLTLAVS
mgnify:CR=1 FL=1